MSAETPAFDMHGIRPDFVTEVRPEDQARLVAAAPDIRILWNPVLKKYQRVQREPGHNEMYYGTQGDGWLEGWAVIAPDYEPPLAIQRVIDETLIQKTIMLERMHAAGFDNESDYADHLFDELVKRADQQKSEQIDHEFFGINSAGVKCGPDFFERESRHGSLPRQNRGAVLLPSGPGAKERARAEKRRLDKALREGGPIVVPA